MPSALLAALLALAPVEAFAQDDDEEGDEPTDVGDDDDDDETSAEPQPGAAPQPESESGSWGVGGDEPEGKYKPRGKTGKLKDLEEDEEVEEEEAEEGPPDLPPPGFAYLDTAIGFGDIVVVEYNTGATKITPTASFLIGVGYRIGDTWQLYARFPISTGEVDGPEEPFIETARNPDTFKQIATGAVEIGVKPHFILSRNLRLPAGLAIAFPSAQGDMYADADNQGDLGKRIVNLGAAASRGWEDRGLFASKRLTLTPSVGVLWQIPDLGPGKLRIGGDTKVEIMIATGGADPRERDLQTNINVEDADNDELNRKRNDVAVNWVLGGHVWYDFFGGLLSPGLRFWLAVGTAEETRGSLDPGGAQFVFEPNIATHVSFLEDEAFGLDARIGYMLPAGGELGGDNALVDASVGGLRITAGFFF
jgi:hypothetical protein